MKVRFHFDYKFVGGKISWKAKRKLVLVVVDDKGTIKAADQMSTDLIAIHLGYKEVGKPSIVGKVSRKVVEVLGVELKVNMQIHMESEHLEDYKKYFGHLQEILESPDYVVKHPRKDSIEYIKVFHENNGEHVLVAVRISQKGALKKI